MKRLIILSLFLVASVISTTSAQSNNNIETSQPSTECDYLSTEGLENKIINSTGSAGERLKILASLYVQAEKEARIYGELAHPKTSLIDWTGDVSERYFYARLALNAKQRLACLRELAKKHSVQLAQLSSPA